ncbi:MAG: hypothetical protein FWH25_00750 [Syntrophorhabdaceae bacterium]|nr:hypothetical protein [Syntrophorhabdaceae bacterium]
MLPIPKHLKDILAPGGDKNSENRVDGVIRCFCGCESFYMKIFADVEEGYPQVCEYEDDYALMVKAVCKDCSKDYLLFDDSKHGWNGFVCHDGVTVSDDELKIWQCTECESDIHNVEIRIMSQGKQDFIEESGIADGETDFLEDDWVEAFGWITIGLKCCGCGNNDEKWIDYETM